MSQHDFEIANQGFPSFRSDLNSGLQALASNNAGATEPSTTYAYQFWYDETTDLLKMRNGDDDAWITLAFFDQTNDEWEVRSAVVQAVDSAGVVIKTDDGNARISVADDGTVSFNDGNITNVGTIDVDSIRGDSDTNTSIDFDGSDVMTFNTGGSEAARIDSSQKVLIGATSSRATYGGNMTAPLQIERAAEGYETGISLTHNQGTGSNVFLRAPVVALARTRGSSLGDNDLVSDGDYLGYLSWEGGDGTNTERAAEINCQVDGTPGNNDMPGRLVFRTTADGASSPTERMRITSDGNLLIGATTQGNPTSGYMLGLQSGGGQTYFSIAKSGQTLDTDGMILGLDSNNAYLTVREDINLRFQTNNTTRMTISNTGAVSIDGSLSKGSGSFKIDHPLKSDTHHLVHSFVEAPQADNIYRGKVDLVKGTATINIDSVAGMTEGTFVALNREIQCFTSNESGWTAVRGSVSGNILTIEAQDNTCTDTVSWMVVGERQDQHMYDTEWTDENGKVIVEPEKEV